MGFERHMNADSRQLEGDRGGTTVELVACIGQAEKKAGRKEEEAHQPHVCGGGSGGDCYLQPQRQRAGTREDTKPTSGVDASERSANRMRADILGKGKGVIVHESARTTASSWYSLAISPFPFPRMSARMRLAVRSDTSTPEVDYGVFASACALVLWLEFTSAAASSSTHLRLMHFFSFPACPVQATCSI